MYLIINLGLKSIRGIIFNKDGQQIFSSSRAVHSKLIEDKVEQDTDEWKAKLESILEEISTSEIISNNIEYITSTTSSSCIYGIDKNGNPITKVMMVSDKRAVAEAKEIGSILKQENKNSSLMCPSSSLLPKALWYKRNNQAIYDKVDYWMGAGEFLNYYFTGEIFTDPLNASKGMYENDSYPISTIRKIGIAPKTLPKVEKIGLDLSVLEAIKKKFIFSNNVKYVLTTYDAICAVVGSFDGEKNTACDVSGTVTSLRILSDQGLKQKKGSILSQKLGEYDKYLIGASNNLGGGIIEWFKQAFYSQNDKNVYYIMENNAQEISIGANGIIFLPYMLGERSPFKSPNARGVFFGIDRGSTLKEFSRAVFESTAFVSNDLLQLIISNDVNVDSISVSGGLARFDLINQIKADVTNKQIKVVENFESTSVGALILLLLSLKKYNSIEEAAKNLIKIRKTINPSEANHFIYKEFFDFYKKLNNHLLPIYDDHLYLKKHIRSYVSETISNL
jgi:sugar (pentulose or hexulose) kinase|tara:strand:- start:11295 stop:12812 length:1518 start_codon:yes stop_codon:yes gene_type:complete